MTLTDNGKIYIATHFGIDNCFSGSGLSWTAVDVNDVTANETGGTAQIVARLLTPSVYKEIRITVPSTQAGTYTNAQLIAANNGEGITVTEVSTEIAGKDGDPATEPTYCSNRFSVDFTCSRLGCYLHEEDKAIHSLLPTTISFDIDEVVDYQFEIQEPEYTYIQLVTIRVDNGNISCVDGGQCGTTTPPGVVVNNTTKTVAFYPPPKAAGLAGTYEFMGPPTGAPTITLDLAALEMRQNSSDFHFEMNDMVITSTSPQKCYIALEVRLFSGSQSMCPTSGSVFTGMDRVSTTRISRIKTLDPDDVNTINADFYQPGTLRGIHTVCLLVHGAWTRQALVDEILPITG